MREDPVGGKAANSSSRRHFLKSGALVAAPLAAMAVPAAAMAAPAAAHADGGTAQALARLKDERALHDLQRALLRETEGTARSRIAGMVEGAGADVAAIRPDLGSDSTLEFSEDGNSAVATHVCKVERAQDFTGTSAVEQMAQLQGNVLALRAENRKLETFFARHADGWLVRNVKLA